MVPTIIFLPSAPRPLTFFIQAIPRDNRHWPARGYLKYLGNGNMIIFNRNDNGEPSAPPEFSPPRMIGQGDVLLRIFLSRLRDVTGKVLGNDRSGRNESLANVPSDRNDRIPRTPPKCRQEDPINWPPLSWSNKPLSGHHFVANPLFDDNKQLKFDVPLIEPTTEDLVLELKGREDEDLVPKLIAISWPLQVPRTRNAGPTPFLIYFHSNMTQNRQVYEGGPNRGKYPFGWDYLFFGLWRYLNYICDPLAIEPFAKGIPYQIKASGKSVVLVLPLSKVDKEVGVFLRASAIEEILKEIQAFMFRRAGNYSPPRLGRTALAAFSASNLLLASFLGSPVNRNHNFYRDILKEIYMFDPPNVEKCTEQAIRWARAYTNRDSNDTDSNKMIRVYVRDNNKILEVLLGRAINSNPPFAMSSIQARDSLNLPRVERTVALIPVHTWHRASTKAREDIELGPIPYTADKPPWQWTHQWISAMMLTDALRRSNFPTDEG